MVVGASAAMTLVMDPPKIHEFMMQIGVKKAHLKLYKMILMGVMSGFYGMIGAHGMVSMLSGAEKNTMPVTLLSGLVFSLALIGIILIGGELFTGNCLLIVAVLSKRIKWWEMVLDWVIIFFSNFAGNILFSVLLLGTGFYGFGYEDEHTAHSNTLCALVHKKTSPPAYQLFFRAIFANFCVCLAVLLSWSATSVDGKIMGMVWPIAVFVMSGYEHCVANQGLFALATLINCPTSHGWYWVNLSVTVPGNIIGAFIIGITYYFITLWGTDLSLKHTPKYAEDGVTIESYCSTPQEEGACDDMGVMVASVRSNNNLNNNASFISCGGCGRRCGAVTRSGSFISIGQQLLRQQQQQQQSRSGVARVSFSGGSFSVGALPASVSRMRNGVILETCDEDDDGEGYGIVRSRNSARSTGSGKSSPLSKKDKIKKDKKDKKKKKKEKESTASTLETASNVNVKDESEAALREPVVRADTVAIGTEPTTQKE